ncbi:unnamed protein product, partial [Adineta steineri]
PPPPPPLPPMMPGDLPPPPPPFPPRNIGPLQPTMYNGNLDGDSSLSKASLINKPVKTIHLHWREVSTNTLSNTSVSNDSLWASLNKVKLDTEKLATLFELKHTDVKIKVLNTKAKKGEFIL